MARICPGLGCQSRCRAVFRHATGRAARLVREIRNCASGSFRLRSGTGGRALRRARHSGGFEFRVLLPGKANPDKITAALGDGVLTVTVPKAETDRPRRIEITGS
jgi:hypothetical protein